MSTTSVTISNTFFDKLKQGELASVCLIKLIRTVEAPMIVKTAGFDGILVDMEHSPLDLDTIGQICLASLYASVPAIVRSPTKQPYFVSRLLDAGALGIMVPHIRTVQDAEDVVKAAKFPPVGNRSATSGLPHLQFRPVPATVASPAVNAATMVIPMIEHVSAVDAVDDIAALPGVDSLMIGANDLTAEMGIPGDYDSERFQSAFARIVAATRKHGKFLGIGGVYGRPDLLERFASLGLNWVLAGSDASLVLAAGTKLAGDMKALGDRVAAAKRSSL